MAAQVYTKKVAEVLVLGVDYSRRLVDGDLLTGTPTASVSPSGLTVGAASKNASAITILGQSVAANKAAVVQVSGGTAGTSYTVTMQAATVSGQTMAEDCVVRVVA